MKSILTLLIVVGLSTAVSAQDTVQLIKPLIVEQGWWADWPEVSEAQHQSEQKGMYALMAWSVANISTGIYGMTQLDGTDKYFYEMNTIWNGVNLGLAGLSLLRKQEDYYSPSQAERAIKQSKIVFGVNALLDVGYMGAGTYMAVRGNNINNDRLEGYGYSVILQGAYLFTFDAVMYFISKKRQKEMAGYNVFDVMDIKAIPGGLSLSYRF